MQGDSEGTSREGVLACRVMVTGRPSLASQTQALLESPPQTVITASWVMLPICPLHLLMSSARAGMALVSSLSVAPHLTVVSTHGGWLALCAPPTLLSTSAPAACPLPRVGTPTQSPPAAGRGRKQLPDSGK